MYLTYFILLYVFDVFYSILFQSIFFDSADLFQASSEWDQSHHFSVFGRPGPLQALTGFFHAIPEYDSGIYLMSRIP